MNRSDSEWVQRGIAPRLQDRLASSPLLRLGPAIAAIVFVVAVRLAGGSDFTPSGLLRDTGRSVPLSVDYPQSILLLQGHPRCEEKVRIDTGTHTAEGLGFSIQNRTNSDLRLAQVMQVSSGGNARVAPTFLSLRPHASRSDFRLLAPLDSTTQKVPDLEPIQPGLTKCRLILKLIPPVSVNSNTSAISVGCKRAFDAFVKNYNSPQADRFSDDTVRTCRYPEEWIETAMQNEPFVTGEPSATAQVYNEQLFLWCVTPDRNLADSVICRALEARSDRAAATLASD